MIIRKNDNLKKDIDLNVEEQTFVGVAGFEPTTSTSQMWRDTGLRYTPNDINFIKNVRTMYSFQLTWR